MAKTNCSSDDEESMLIDQSNDSAKAYLEHGSDGNEKALRSHGTKARNHPRLRMSRSLKDEVFTRRRALGVSRKAFRGEERPKARPPRSTTSAQLPASWKSSSARDALYAHGQGELRRCDAKTLTSAEQIPRASTMFESFFTRSESTSN